MEIAYLIGNGFDLNLGLKTKYDDFYNYYINNHTTSIKSVLKFKGEIETYIKSKSDNLNINWSDLEIALGKYTVELSSFEDLELIYQDLNINLRNYIKQQELSLNIQDNIKLKRDLIFPFNNLREIDKSYVQTYISRFKKEDFNIDIITFNYTNSFEKIIGNKKVNHLKVGYNHRGKPCWLNSILHIHGNIDDNIIFGVNDVSQLENDNL